MTRILGLASGPLIALALMFGGVSLAPASAAQAVGSIQSGAAQHMLVARPRGPNCLTPRPCPPPENRSTAGVAGLVQPGDARHSLVAAAGGPICLTTPCPPPKNQ